MENNKYFAFFHLPIVRDTGSVQCSINKYGLLSLTIVRGTGIVHWRIINRTVILLRFGNNGIIDISCY